MLKITKKTIKRRISLEEFMKLKEDPPFEDYRQMAKAVNFGFLFGLVAPSFASNTLEIAWSEEKADQYIKDNKLRDLKETIINRFPSDTPKQWKMITCATDIRSKFFKTYPGLMDRINRERSFVQNNGYVRAWSGACRRTSELFFAQKNEKGKVVGDDEKVYKRVFSTLLNVAANAPIQNFEATLVMRSITELNTWLKENNMKSYVWGSVHDSIDMCIHKDEVEIVGNKLIEICTKDRPELFQMPMGVDVKLADILKGETYKGGRKLKSFISSLKQQ